MRIVHQSAADLHSPFLALPAPHIAGLLPSGVIPSSLPPADPVLAYTFNRPALADLSEAQRTRLFEAADILLEFAIEYLIGTFEESALRAAEVLFHRAAGGTSEIRRVGPKAFNAEQDADWLEMLAQAKRIKPISHAEAEAIVAQTLGRKVGGAA